MVRSFNVMLASLRSWSARPGIGAHAPSTRQHGPALGVAALVAVAALGGCADQAGPVSASARNGQDASWQVAGPTVPAPQASRAGTQTCYGGASGLVDDCGAFARYNGP